MALNDSDTFDRCTASIVIAEKLRRNRIKLHVGQQSVETLAQSGALARPRLTRFNGGNGASKERLDPLANLVTVASGVKVQVEFNPSRVAAYRLIGYDNRRIADPDFANDEAMGGILGAGRTVVALYEIIPHGYGHARPGVEAYKYRSNEPAAARRGEGSPELLTVKVRYQGVEGGRGRRVEVPLVVSDGSLDEMSDDFRLSAAAAAFGMVLRDSPYGGASSYRLVQELAPREQSEFRSLVRAAERVARRP